MKHINKLGRNCLIELLQTILIDQFETKLTVSQRKLIDKQFILSVKILNAYGEQVTFEFKNRKKSRHDKKTK